MINSYPKVYNLGHRALRELTNGPVVISEKVDGSQFSIKRLNGELMARSKGKQITIEEPEKLFARGIEAVSKLDLHDGWTYRGELLDKPKHNALAYDRVPRHHVILFDISFGEAEFLSPAEVLTEAKRIGLEVVPTFFEGELRSTEQLHELLETISILGGQKIEGVVVKNYAQWDPATGKTLMGKYVSEAFKEVHKKAWGESNPAGKDIIVRLTEQFKTPARWEKAIQHLRERGELDKSPKDIGALIKEAQRDTLEECEDEIKEALFKWARPHIVRGVTSGLPKWYKAKLTERQFEG